MSRRGLTLAVAGALLVLLVALGSVLPVPYVVLVPGPVTDTLGSVSTGAQTSRPVVSASGARTYPTSGHLFLTTVGVVPGSCSDHPTLWQALQAWWNHEDSVEPHQVICPPDESSQQVQQQNEQEMSQSQRDAVTAALLQLGYKPTKTTVLVGDVSPGTPADGRLESGDVIDSVNGTAVTGPAQLRRLITAVGVGGQVTVGITRDNKHRDVQLHTINAGDGRPVIGVQLDINAQFRNVKVKIGINPADVGGPSAGLAFTLGIIDKLTPGSLTAGHTVAVTGTIDGFGQVGPIGGIQQKIAGASRQGATIFLAPAADCSDAKKVAPSSMTLVKVDTLKTALSALKTIATGGTNFPRC
jgi:PDZ domain-containing protein